MSKLRLLFLIMATAVQAEPFECLPVFTRQDPSMDWWYAVPEPFGPKLHPISSVCKGEFFRIIPFFKNYGVDSNQIARITFDIEVLRPDGSIDIKLSRCEGHDGPALASALIPAEAVLNLCFDAADPSIRYR